MAHTNLAHGKKPKMSSIPIIMAITLVPRALLTLPPTPTYKTVRKTFNPTRCGWWQGT